MSRPRLSLGVLGAGLVLLAAAPAAQANRPATAAEEAAVNRDLGAAPAVGPRCSAYLVSTASGDGAAYVRIQPIDPLPAGCAPAGSGFVVARSAAGTLGPWLPVIPGRPEALESCADAAVPNDVGADLAACTPSSAPSDAKSRTTLGCYPNDGAMVLMVQRRKPSRCLVRGRVPIETFRPQQSGTGFDLRGMTWKRWGTSRATGTGTAAVVKGQRTSRTRVKVTVTATTIKTDGGRLFYTKLRVRLPTGSVVALDLNWAV
ncbi:hypothetical protein [Patulibacter minatonensis]|uniref:hypothetical protein n=1 Tax=Patulibacter minatonensis TaxID=298163 RepID=UPI00047A7653|nr:hypothetical protein [Patulibacter minatonensis]